jgi:hypothetical protein
LRICFPRIRLNILHNSKKYNFLKKNFLGKFKFFADLIGG